MSSKLSGIKDFLTFSRGERNGIIILIVLILILLFVPIFYNSFITQTPSNDSFFYSQVDSFFSSLKAKPDDIAQVTHNTLENEEVETKQNQKYFFFDPNTVTVNELVLLGLSVKQATVVEKFRSKGGQFNSPEDFAKVYVIDSSIYRKLRPWIKISKLPQKIYSQSKKDSLPKVDKTPIIVELNSADTLELVKIKGIGKVYARRIIAYRNLLGGYINITQLREVYGIKPELVGSISSQIVIDSTRIKMININLISYEELKKHPYISEYQAKAIIYYRNKVGSIKNKNELLKNKILPFEKFKNISSYLTVY